MFDTTRINKLKADVSLIESMMEPGLDTPRQDFAHAHVKKLQEQIADEKARLRATIHAALDMIECDPRLKARVIKLMEGKS